MPGLEEPEQAPHLPEFVPEPEDPADYPVDGGDDDDDDGSFDDDDDDVEKDE
nr:hypothetical protein [Tanacetum cinerariifolium]